MTERLFGNGWENTGTYAYERKILDGEWKKNLTHDKCVGSVANGGGTDEKRVDSASKIDDGLHAHDGNDAEGVIPPVGD
jgi:hypothetical protein